MNEDSGLTTADCWLSSRATEEKDKGGRMKDEKERANDEAWSK